MVVSPNRQSGYMAILAVVIIGAAALAVALALLGLGTDSQRSGLVGLQSKQARDLALACGYEAMQQLHDDIAYGGTGAFKQGQGSCTYSVTVTSTTGRTINASGLVGAVVRNLQATVTVGSSTLSISTWKEVATAAVTPAFVQVASATSASSVSSLAPAFSSAQTAGDTNVVIIGWKASTGTISSVTDSQGNTYQVAATLTRGTNLSQAIYYAKNIASGANTVTVTFSAAVASPDVRVVEYSGLDQLSPLDVSASASGTSNAPSSGSLTTTAATSLIVGGGTTQGSFTAPGSNFWERAITTNSNLAEDQTKATTGSYSATGSLTASAAWVMQAVAFKGAGQ